MPISNGYCSLAEVKNALRIADTTDDALLELAVESASRLIDGYCNRAFYSTAGTRVFVPVDPSLAYVDDIAAVTSIKTSSDADGLFDVTWSASDYQLEPVNGISGGLAQPYTRVRAVGGYVFPMSGGEATLQVTATFGWSAVPSAVRQACVIQSSRIFKRLDSPLGVAGFGDMGAIRVSRGLDPDVQQLVDPLRRIGGVG